MADKRTPMGAARHKFFTQRTAAKRRGIAFELTFDEWWTIWKRSRRWSRRGRMVGQFVMARIGDVGAYRVGNVMIIGNKANSSAGNVGRSKPRRPEVTIKIWKTRHARAAMGMYK